MKVLLATDDGAPARAAQELLVRIVERGRNEIVVLGRADLPEGPPGPAIVRELATGNFDVAVLGAGNRSWLGRLLLGSVSTKVLHSATSSVLIVHGFENTGEPVKVLVGTDGSSDANAAVDQLIELVDPASCQVEVVSVAEHLMPQMAWPIPRVGYATSALTPEQEEQWTAVATDISTAAAGRFQEAGFNAEGRAVLGAPGPRLLAEAKESRAHLVAVGSTGLGAIERAVVGSVSDQIVREVPAAFIARTNVSVKEA